jgi:hypothetical protein
MDDWSWRLTFTLRAGLIRWRERSFFYRIARPGKPAGGGLANDYYTNTTLGAFSGGYAFKGSGDSSISAN